MTDRKRILGVDYGKVRVGLAVSDPDRKLASPLATYTRRDPQQDARYFQKLVADEEISQLVVGLPLHLDGRAGTAARAAQEFGRWLGEITALPCAFWDERFTTREAESALWEAGLTHRRRKDRRDRVAAQILLQSFLDSGCPTSADPIPK